MKPFDLEKAKAGAKVVTRSGLPVRIICFDRIGSAELLGLILEDGREQCYSFFTDGSFIKGDPNHHYDLFMAPVMREGWIGISLCTERQRDSLTKIMPGCVALSTDIYDTEARAKEVSSPEDKIIKIQWEE